MNIGGSKHPIKERLEQAVAGCETTDEVVEAVMELLHSMRVVMYRGENVVPVLAPAGRVLVDLALHRDTSLRELSQRQGTTESSVTKQMTHLVEAGLVHRTRSGKRNTYTLNLKRTLEHPDISALVEALILSGRTDG